MALESPADQRGGCAFELPDAVVGGPHQDEGSRGGQQSQRLELFSNLYAHASDCDCHHHHSSNSQFMAILLHLFGSTQGEEKKRQTGRFLNLNNLPFLDKVAMALQDIGEAMRGSDVNELIENLAEINHYDLKVILDAMQIITTEVMHMTSVGHRQSVQSLNSFAVSRRVISENGLSKMRSNLNDTCESRPKDRGSQRSIASSRTSQNTLGTHMSVADSDMPKKNDDQTDEKSNAPAESASSPAEGSSAVVEAEYNVAELESVGISLPAQGRVVAENL